jgi:hypothetical protein
MTRRLTPLIVALCAGGLPFVHCAAVMPVAPQLKIRDLKASYTVNAAIPFTIIKHARGEVVFACAAEMQMDGRWQEVRSDIISKALEPARQPRSHSIATDR